MIKYGVLPGAQGILESPSVETFSNALNNPIQIQV